MSHTKSTKGEAIINRYPTGKPKAYYNALNKLNTSQFSQQCEGVHPFREILSPMESASKETSFDMQIPL